jgi:ubiquitin-conjugating enzyme E2 Q
MLNATFPAEYPYKPPFIRVIYPRFKFMTGHITIGGSICMEVLTLSGWSPGYSIENLIMQIKSEIVDPGGEARIDLSRHDHYHIAEAKESFDRLCAKYGWK